MRRLLIPLCLLFALAGCGSSGQTGVSVSSAGLPATTSILTPAPTTVAHPPTTVAHDRVRGSRRRAPRAAHAENGFAYSIASANKVQRQPSPGSCHATGHGLYSSPDPHCTPGALNPAVRQATIDHTICMPGYTKTIRPPESVTEPEKVASMAAYGVGGRSPHDFEYDHLVSLELGGAVNDPRNLWPEPGESPNPKDSVEDHLHRLVCDGQMPLAQAQHIIATDWVRYANAHARALGGSAPAASHAPGATPPSPSPPRSSGPTKPISEVNCSDFSTHAAAQQWFTAHGGSPSNDVAGLDGDHDGTACESLP